MKEHLQSGPGQPGQSLPAHKLALCAATAGAVAGVTGNPAGKFPSYLISSSRSLRCVRPFDPVPHPVRPPIATSL